ncbi:MAG: triose-phosphate isomerase [Candidatus Riflebacteria bacterium]|nr:triose-phosphate isomerase [Candidatus Riflebacteria bacterium]
MLIISDNPSRFFIEPLALSPDKCRAAKLDSIRYLGFSALQTVVIDCASISQTLKKVSLGIRDDHETQSLWELLSGTRGPKVYLLVEKMAQTSPEMQQLGVEYIIPGELRKLVDTTVDQQTRSFAGSEKFTQSTVLTADDVRSLHQNGARNLPDGCTLTPWAAEVAASLNLSNSKHQLYFLLPVIAESRQGLANQREELFSLASRFPGLLFIVNELYLPVFNGLFPSLSGRTVAPSVHWASHGAFTGEVSVQMLVDQRCFGAIIPPKKPYTDPENLKKLSAPAQKHGLALFCTFTLASNGTCDIIASDRRAADGMISLYQSGVVDPGRLPESGAVAVTKDFLQQITIRKGN